MLSKFDGMATSRCRLAKLLRSTMLLHMVLCSSDIVQIGDAAGCTRQTCTGLYVCTPSTTMNLTVNVSRTVQSMDTSGIRQANLQISWQQPPDTSAAAAGALEYKLCVHEDNPSFTSGCPYALDVVEQLPMNSTQYELVGVEKIWFQCPYILQLEFLPTSECRSCTTMRIPQLVIDIYEKDPVILADFSNVPDTDSGWYKLVVNLSLPQDSSPYLVVGAPHVTVQWAQVPLDYACQPLHNYAKNTLALINTQDLLGKWNTTSVSLPPLSSDECYEVTAQTWKGAQWFMYKQPPRVCRAFRAPVLFPATVERVWAVVRANVPDQLNVTVGWDDRVASYGEMKQFEVDFITESAVQPKESRIFKVPVESLVESSELNASLQLPNAREHMLTRVRAVSEFGSGNWSHEVMVYDGTVQPSQLPAETTPLLAAFTVPVVIVLVLLACGVLFVVAMTCRCLRGKRHSELSRQWWGRPMCEWDESGLADTYEVDPSEVVCNEEDSIGDGNFGKVWLGTFHGQAVAIKTMKRDVESRFLESFLAEIHMLKRVTHGGCPHVVNMVAASSYSNPVLLVMELAAYGSLLDYLRRSRPNFSPDVPYANVVNNGEMLDFAIQIAKGMEFIASQNVIHCDLACRNILLSDNGLVKVCDFGLSRATSLYVQRTRRPVPIRWMAPESIESRTFTTMSDVWSFGVTVWEIYSLGMFPYGPVDDHRLLAYLNDGFRLKRPAQCSESIYCLIRSCWVSKPDQRPAFSYLVSCLARMEDVTEERHEVEDRRDEAICGQDRDWSLETHLSITASSFLAQSHDYYKEAESDLEDVRSECRLLSRSATVRSADKERTETPHTSSRLTCNGEEADEDMCCQC